MKCIVRWLKTHVALLVCVVLTIIFVVFCNMHLSEFLWNRLSNQSGALAAWLYIIGIGVAIYQIYAVRRSARFKIMQDRFNDPAMRFARAAFAWIRLNPEQGIKQTNGWRIQLFGWEVVDFLCSVAQLVDKDKIEFDDAEMTYARHVLSICGDPHWKESLENDDLKLRYAPLLNLYMRIKKSGRFITPVDELKAGIYDEPFWYCELRLADQKEVEASVMAIRERRS
jgi:hypothetical protein